MILAPTSTAASADRDDEVLVLIDDKPAGAVKAWSRVVTAIDPHARSGARQLRGPWLDAGMTYALPIGAAVVSCVQHSETTWRTTLANTTPDGLDTIKIWDHKSPLGKRIVDFIARQLSHNAANHTARRLDPRPNRFDGRCRRCHQPVPARAGQLLEDSIGHYVVHKPGECLPPPEVVAPNHRGEPCLLCGNWVEPYTAVALRLATPDARGRNYRAAHQAEPGGCPVDARPGPMNRVSGWCTDCGELVEPEHGYWDPTTTHVLKHAGPCPTSHIVGPTWTISRPRHEPPFDVGEARRVRVDRRRPGNGAEVPTDAPGRRQLAEHYVEFVGLVMEVVKRPGGHQHARICPATVAEATDDLVADAVSALDVRPDAGGFTAGWSAERIGKHKLWLAEITGRHPNFGFERKFHKPHRDYSAANSKGTRGVIYQYELLPNRVYEAREPISHRRARRVFLRATPDGDVQEITRDEVEAWLNHATTWHAS